MEIRPLRTPEEFHACVELQKEIWGESCAELVPAALLRVVQHVGGVAAGAFDGSGRLAGFIFGISGVRKGQLAHWSDTLGVRPELRNQGLGERLKRFQRDLLLPEGIEVVHWTFDPLESRNAYLNFARLGTTASEYHRDFYGETGSPLHEGIGTDRLLVHWEIASERVRQRLSGEENASYSAGPAGIPLINPTRSTAAGLQSSEPDLTLDAPRLRIAIPLEIQQLKLRSPALAAEWRSMTRLAFESYFARGYVAGEVVREAERTSYVLEKSGREIKVPIIQKETT